ncbi:MAG: MarR family winged helix-turn-helix transcriptional regulator [Steroidobacteraceae bacterium]
MSETPQSFIYLLKHAELAVRGCVEVALEQFGLTPNQFLMLLRLNHREGQSAAELARSIGVRPQSLTEIINPLVAKGLIAREESPEHRRILRISLSASGRQLLARATRVGQQLERDLVVDLSAEEQATLLAALDGVVRRAQAHECHPEVRRVTAIELAKRQIARPWVQSRGRRARRRAV